MTSIQCLSTPAPAPGPPQPAVVAHRHWPLGLLSIGPWVGGDPRLPPARLPASEDPPPAPQHPRGPGEGLMGRGEAPLSRGPGLNLMEKSSFNGIQKYFLKSILAQGFFGKLDYVVNFFPKSFTSVGF